MDQAARGVEIRLRRRVLFLHAVLFVLVLAVFLPAADNDFIGFDDPDYVTANPVVQRGLTAEGISWALTATAASNWHPLTWISHMLDVELSGRNPAGHHLTSIVLHGVNTLLVFAVLRALTGAVGRSWFVAALFGLHPLRVESVAWVAERKDVLAAFFWLVTTLAYVRWVRFPAGPESPGISRVAQDASRWYWFTVLLFALGLMCKPMLVTLPFTLLLLDAWPLQRLDRQTVRARVMEKLPLFLLSAASCVITFLVQRTAGAVNETLPPGLRLSNIIVSLARYLGKIFWPADLAFFYPLPDSWPTPAVLGALLLLGVISALALLYRRHQPAFLGGWLWYLGTLVPVIGIVAVGQQAIADRYTYLPTLGIFLALVWGLHALTVPRRALARLTGAAGLGGLAVLAALTHRQIGHWQTTETLCRHALAVTRGNHLAHDLLGVALGRQGHFVAALREHEASLRLQPNSAVARNNTGAALQKLGRFDEAIPLHLEALQLRPRFPEAFYNLGTAYEQTGRAAEAITNYLQAIALRPTHADARYNLGTLFLRLGQWEAAREQFEATRALTPDSPEVLNNLGVVQLNLGRYADAVRCFEQAIALQPDNPKFYFNAGAGHQNQGNITAAVRYYQETLRLQPTHPEARINLEGLTGVRTNR